MWRLPQCTGCLFAHCLPACSPSSLPLLVLPCLLLLPFLVAAPSVLLCLVFLTLLRLPAPAPMLCSTHLLTCLSLTALVDPQAQPSRVLE